jgi:hypothetical protein
MNDLVLGVSKALDSKGGSLNFANYLEIGKSRCLDAEDLLKDLKDLETPSMSGFTRSSYQCTFLRGGQASII